MVAVSLKNVPTPLPDEALGDVHRLAKAAGPEAEAAKHLEIGVSSLYRYQWEDQTLTLDEDWGFVTVTEEGDLTALTPNLTEDWAFLQVNTGSRKPMPVWAISTSDPVIMYRAPSCLPILTCVSGVTFWSW